VLRMTDRALLDNMMTPEERAALAALPARIPVWRGLLRLQWPTAFLGRWTVTRPNSSPR